MAYTFWHCGVLIGESDLQDAPDNPRQLGGIFWPTAYGLQVFPRLSGMLTAAHALKAHMQSNGLSEDDMERPEVDEIFEKTQAGQKVIDIGRMLTDVEMRSPDGQRVEIASIAFSDIMEMQQLARDMQLDAANVLAELPPDAPRYIVSATVKHRAPAPSRDGKGHRFRH